VYARNTPPPPTTWPDPGWTQVASSMRIAHKQDIKLNSGSTRYRYYLLWMTSLGGHAQLAIAEVTLYR
jgi:hypothetical protein